MKEICRFCEISRGNIFGEENRLISENASFFSLASIGALVEGWVLVSPKEHLYSLKDAYDAEGFVEFANSVMLKMRQHYCKQIIAFEHGPNKCDSSTSCGTNHAHLHLVPYSQSLYNDMLKTGLTWEKCPSDQISSRVGSNEYLFYCELSFSLWENPLGYLHILKKPISQYFRKIIAYQLNCYDEYDYKRYPRIEFAIETNSVLSDNPSLS